MLHEGGTIYSDHRNLACISSPAVLGVHLSRTMTQLLLLLHYRLIWGSSGMKPRMYWGKGDRWGGLLPRCRRADACFHR